MCQACSTTCPAEKQDSGSTRLLVAWDKCELSTRAPPLSTFSLAALADKAVALHDRPQAISLLLEFHCMLRTGDLLKIRKMDLSFMEQHSRGIVVLHETKSVQRTASSETVVIFNAYLVRMLAIVCRNLAPAEFLVESWTPKVQLVTLQPPARSGYNTFLFAARSVGSHHGPRKWASAKAARLYIGNAIKRTCHRMSAKSHHGD